MKPTGRAMSRSHPACSANREQCAGNPSTESRLPVALSIHRRWSRQRDSIENFADKKVSLNGGQVFSYDLIVEPQTKQASGVAWGFKLNDDPLD